MISSNRWASRRTSGRLNRFFAGRDTCWSWRRSRFRSLLLFSAGLFFRGALKAGAFYPGFDRQGGISAEMDFTLGGRMKRWRERTMFAAVHRVRAAARGPGGGADDDAALRQHHQCATRHADG